MNNNAINNNHKQLIDISFLILVTIILQSYFLFDLGFYSDDWSFLGALSNTKPSGLLTFIYNFFLEVKDTFITRPIHVIQLATLYYLFSTSPLGYHLSNLIFLIFIVTLFYLALKKLRLPRIAAFTIPLIYTLLPHYSTARMWPASFIISISTCFFLFNLYASLNYIEALESGKHKQIWILISLISLVISILSYEVALPLFIINFLIIWRKSRNINLNITGFIASSIFILFVCTLFKAIYSTRMGGYDSNYVTKITKLYIVAIVNDFYTYGLKLPKHIWHLFQTRTSENIFFIAFALSIAIFLYLITFKIQAYKRSFWLLTIFSGAVIYLVGYSIFLTNNQIIITPTGIGNRVTTAASFGVAICFFGLSGLLCYYISNNRVKRFAFAFLISILCGFGYIVNCTIATFYSQSYFIQSKILNSIYKTLPKLTAKNTLILDGICPYIGPAPIFDCDWDLAGALQLHYKNTRVQADVRTNRLTYDRNGLTTTTYGRKTFYAFDKNLIIYNYQTKKYFTLKSFEDANTYFTTELSADISNCPEGKEGHGVNIL